MMFFIIYIMIAVVVTAICQRVVYKGVPLDGSRPYPKMDAPPRIALSIATGVFWPPAVFVLGPAYLLYVGTNKVLDKIQKV